MSRKITHLPFSESRDLGFWFSCLYGIHLPPEHFQGHPLCWDHLVSDVARMACVSSKSEGERQAPEGITPSTPNSCGKRTIPLKSCSVLYKDLYYLEQSHTESYHLLVRKGEESSQKNEPFLLPNLLCSATE